MCPRGVVLRHGPRPCSCLACVSERTERAENLRRVGTSLTRIAELLNISVTQAFRLSRRVPAPIKTVGRDGKTYRRRQSKANNAASS